MSLQGGRIGWLMVAGLSISIVIAGQFSGWNYGLAHGWANMFVATLLTASLYMGISFCVAELSSALPNAGGFAFYSEIAFGRYAGFFAGFAVFLALTIGTGAAANFVAAYTQSIFGVGGWAIKALLFAVVIGLHLRGVGEALGLVLVAGAVAVAALLLFCFTMIPHFDAAHLHLPNGEWGLSLKGLFAAIPFAIWLFLGVEQAASASEEARDPGKTMPLGLIGGMVVLLFTASGILLLAPGGGNPHVASAGDPLYAAMTLPDGDGSLKLVRDLVGLGAIFGLFATFFSLTYSASRQLYALGRNGSLPKIVAYTNRRGAPAGALVVIGLVAAAITLLPADQVLVAVVLLLGSCYVLTLAAYITLRKRLPDLDRPFRAPGGVVTASLCLVMSVVAVIACFQLSWPLLIGLAVALAVGSTIFAVHQTYAPAAAPTAP